MNKLYSKNNKKLIREQDTKHFPNYTYQRQLYCRNH